MHDIFHRATDARRGRAVHYNGLIFLSGQTADDRTQSIRGQTRQTLAKIDAILGKSGTDKTRILNAQIWLKNIAADFVAMNEVWDSWIDPAFAPARATAECAMGAPELLIEIIILAADRP